MAAGALGPLHRRRLREQWRSAGWPCHDTLELDLLAAGLLQRVWDCAGRETLRVTDAGLRELAAARQRHQAALDPHEALVQQVALSLQRAGRLVWCGLSLRAPLPPVLPPSLLPSQPVPTSAPVSATLFDGLAGPADAQAAQAAPAPPPRWVVAMPDVFSIRHTTLESATAPVVHEIKVRRADLLGDLRRPDKGAAYLALACECWYVLRHGIAQPEEIPPAYGVLLADEQGQGLSVARPAPHRPMTLPFLSWMALARARLLAEPVSAQAWLGEDSGESPDRMPT